MILTTAEQIGMAIWHFDTAHLGDMTRQSQFKFSRGQIPNFNATINKT